MKKYLFRFSGIFLPLLLIFSAFGQNTPGTLNYPTTLDNQDSLFRTNDKAQSTLATAVNSSATAVTVANAVAFPISGALIIDNEIIFYTAKSGNNLTGLIRGASATAAAAHSVGAAVKGAIFSVHHNTQSQAIIRLQTKLGIGNFTPSNNNFLVGSGSGSSTWRTLLASDIPSLDAGKITSGTFGASLLGTGTANSSTYLRGDGVWATVAGGGGGGSGTVTSVGLSLPGIFTVSNSPVTSSGTMTATLVNQSPNLVFASPSSATGVPSFRALVASDVPNLDAAKTTSGVFSTARLGTGTASSSTYLRGDNTWATVSGGVAIGDTIGSATAKSILFAGTSGALAQNNSALQWDNTSGAEKLTVTSYGGSGTTTMVVRNGNNNGYYPLQMQIENAAYGTSGSIRVTNANGLDFHSGSNDARHSFSTTSYQMLNISAKTGEPLAFFTPVRSDQTGILIRNQSSQTADALQVQNNSGSVLSQIDALGAFHPPTLADSAAQNNSIYYSSTANKLVYKDSSGVVNNLY